MDDVIEEINEEDIIIKNNHKEEEKDNKLQFYILAIILIGSSCIITFFYLSVGFISNFVCESDKFIPSTNCNNTNIKSIELFQSKTYCINQENYECNDISSQIIFHQIIGIIFIFITFIITLIFGIFFIK